MLSWVELERVARVLAASLAGARVDRVVQPQSLLVGLRLYTRAGETPTLVLCADPEHGRVSLRDRVPASPEGPPPFAQFLRKHLKGARVREVGLRGEERQLSLRLDTAEGERELLLALFGRRSNLFLLDEEGRLLRTLRPLAETRPELAIGEPWRDPEARPPRRGEDRFASLTDDALAAGIEAHYAQVEEERSGSDRARRLEVALRKERKQAARRLERVEAELAEADQAGLLARQGELLKSQLDRVEPGSESVRVRDWDSGEEVEIPLDPRLPPRANLEALFKRYQKLLRRLTKAGAQVEEARARVEALEALESRRQAAAGDPARLCALAEEDEVAGLLARHAPAARRPAPERRDEAPRKGPFKDLPRRLHPRRYRSSDGLEIWVGRSDEGNDHLSTRLARGKDLFFHVEATPGSHVVLRTGGRSDPPQESLLEACELAAHFSKAKKAGRVDVHVCPIRSVKKPRGAKPGLVYVTDGRTLHLRREEARLRRILSARIDDAP